MSSRQFLNSRRWLASVTLAVVVLVAGPVGASEGTDETLPPELMRASKVAILGLEMDFSLRNKFTSALEDWDRFELVMFPDEADICMALSTRPDYTQEVVESGAADSSADEDNPLRGRAKGTMRTVDRLYFKVFVSGGAELWLDDADLGADDEAAAELLGRLRQRMEQQEAGSADGTDEDEDANDGGH